MYVYIYIYIYMYPAHGRQPADHVAELEQGDEAVAGACSTTKP